MTPLDLFNDDDQRKQEEHDNPDLWTYRLRKVARLQMFDRMANEAADNAISFTHGQPKHDLDGYEVVRSIVQRQVAA